MVLKMGRLAEVVELGARNSQVRLEAQRRQQVQFAAELAQP